MDRQQEMTADWLQRKQIAPALGTPPLMSPPNPLTHGAAPPFAGQDPMRLTLDQRQERQKWAVDEARRLIEARQRTSRPASPVTMRTNQIYDPRQIKDTGQAEQAQRDAMAQEVSGRLARRDRGLI